jgi:hypothetical protein
VDYSLRLVISIALGIGILLMLVLLLDGQVSGLNEYFRQMLNL